jgi:hypothetical protein
MLGRMTSAFISLLGLALMFTSDARAQVKTERAVTSNFVKVWLPSDAEEITPETVPAQITQVLGKVVADAGRGRFKQYDTQVLIWRGAAFRKAGADAIIKSLTEKFKKMEYRYEAGEAADGVTPFRIDDDSAGTTVVGFYLVTRDGLLWAWTQVYE